MVEYLKQTTSGMIYIKTKILAARDDMVPYVQEPIQSEKKSETIENWVETVFNKTLAIVSKDELDEVAETIDHSLDRRKSKKNMAKELRKLMER